MLYTLDYFHTIATLLCEASIFIEIVLSQPTAFQVMPPTHNAKTNTSIFRPDCLAGKVALVTGGGSGICFEVTKQLLLHGVTGAVICGRRKNFLERSAALLEQETGKVCKYCVCDVRDPEACQRAVQVAVHTFGRLDILVNGAAGNFLAAAKDLKPKGFATVMGIDAIGTFNMCSAAFPALAKPKVGESHQQDAIVINISATLQCPATHWQAHASAAKAAVDSLTRSLALEWGEYKVRVVGIAPGPIKDTPGTTKLAPGMTGEEMDGLIGEGIPLGRMGEAFEIGHAAVYLASPSARYITGTNLIVDGGEWLYKPPMVPKDMVATLSRKVEAKSRSQAPQSRL
ncbi:dehydrogenase [Nitzschia inconspicua]|uniref:2,4-dienoyl-CoA reductase [(3E)-enoyl-CoA-producing] n=1 Tax=Nitzschia inconspicua TaxID=303405 RepID=A0A9K3KR02_9STRA|nr:dehydrogenase [Nitzschia inconspicua]